MSGIFAFTGSEPCRDILLKGISLLSRRGKELCGIAVKSEEKITLFKIHGSPETLLSMAESIKSMGYTGLAECAKAERAKPSAITSVPCASEQLAVAVDGDIENFDELKRRLKVSFPIATNEDLMLALLSLSNGENPLKRLNEVFENIKGSPTVAFITSEEEAVYCRAGDSPIAVGIYENGCAAASGLYALSDGAKRFFILEKGETARITKERTAVYDERLKRIKKSLLPMPEIRVFENDFSPGDEVFCLPIAVKDTLGALTKGGNLSTGSFNLSRRGIEKLSRIILTGSGASFRAALLGAFHLEQLSDIPCCALPSGELRFSPTVFGRNTLLVAVSERGEHPDTLACIERARNFGAKTLAVTSAPYSFIARSCDYVINPNSDFSDGGISLRSFISGALALDFFALSIGYSNEIISDIYLNVSLKIAEMLPGKISSAIKPSQSLSELSGILSESKKIILTGLCADFALSCEAAEKLRSISSANALALSLSELENESAEYLKDSSVIAFITSPETAHKALCCLRRLRTLGAAVTIITSANIEEEINDFEEIVSFADSIPLFNWISAIACIYKAAADTAEEKESTTAQEAV